MLVEDWKNCEQVTVSGDLSAEEKRDLYFWVLENVGYKGKDWEWVGDPEVNQDVVFVFASHRLALLFQLKWSHVCTI